MELKQLYVIATFLIGAIVVTMDIGCDFLLFWMYVDQDQAYTKFCNCGPDCTPGCGPDPWEKVEIFDYGNSTMFTNLHLIPEWDECCKKQGNSLEMFAKNLRIIL